MRLAAAFAVVLASAPALAQSPAHAPAATGSPAVSSSPPAATAHGPTPFVTALARGADAYHRRDYDTAMTAFREASTLDSQSPTPRLYIGYLQATRGDATGAMANFREALRLATVANDDQARARALTAVAILHEAQGRWDDARLAWQDDVAFADAHPPIAYPATARARMDAIQARAALDQQYAPVRQRIADRLRANASGATTTPGATAATPATATPATATPATATPYVPSVTEPPAAPYVPPTHAVPGPARHPAHP